MERSVNVWLMTVRIGAVGEIMERMARTKAMECPCNALTAHLTDGRWRAYPLWPLFMSAPKLEPGGVGDDFRDWSLGYVGQRDRWNPTVPGSNQIVHLTAGDVDLQPLRWRAVV
jgi:hypothetical protein